MTSENTKDIFDPDNPIVPSNWEILSFKKAVDVISDQGKRIKKKQYLEKGKIPVIDQGQEYIGGYTDDESLAFDGELPVVLFGDHTRSVKFVDKSFVVGAEGIKILKPKDYYEPKFFFYLLRSLQIPSRGYSRHFQFLKKFKFPLAPLEQQKRIVAEIEKQFSRLDEAVANLKRVNANLKRYKAAVLKAAVEGELTEKWREEHPDVEPADKLLERILTERRKKWEEAELAKMKAKGKVPKDDKWKKKYKEPAEPDVIDLPELPHGWKWVTVEQVSILVTDGDHNPPKRVESGMPHLTAKNVINGKITEKGCTFIKTEDFEIVRKRYEPQGDDVIVTCVGTIGRTAIVPGGYIFSADRNLAVVRLLRNGILPQILKINFDSPGGQHKIQNASGSTAQPHFYLGNLRAFVIALMPTEEQSEIMKIVEEKITDIVHLEISVEANLKRAERLRQSILSKAFSGKLLPFAYGHDEGLDHVSAVSQ